MFDQRTTQLLNYLNSQIASLTSFNETENKKGTDAKLATAHKEGYIEGLNNIKQLIETKMKYK